MVKDTFPDVEVQRQTVLTGGLLKKFPPEKTEFVRLKKGEKWLIHAVCGPMNRQCGLRRTKMVDDLITAALAAADGDEAADEAAVAIDDAPRPHDPMVDFSYGDDDSPPQEAGDPDETPKKKKEEEDYIQGRDSGYASPVQGDASQIHRRSPGGVLRRG